MKRRISILFIFMLLFQSMASSFAMPAQVFAEGIGLHEESEGNIEENVIETGGDGKESDLRTDEAPIEEEVEEHTEATKDEAADEDTTEVLDEGTPDQDIAETSEDSVEDESDTEVGTSDVETKVEAQASNEDMKTFAAVEENLLSSFEFVINPGPNKIVVTNGDELEVDLNDMNAIELVYGITKPDEINIAEGDTYTIDLPSLFAQSVQNQPIIVDDVTVGTYSIVGNQLIITFSESVNDFDNVEMDVNLTGSFNTEIFETEEEVVVEVPFSDGNSYTATIRAKQQDYDGEDRKSAGIPYVLNDGEKVEVDRNPTHIDWTVRVNDSMDSFDNATVIDDLGENLSIEEGSFIIERIIRNYNNEEVRRELVDITPTITGGGFELALGDIEDAYEITYTTSIDRPDGGGTHAINNNARIILDGTVTEVSDDFEGTWSGDLPAISKDGSLSNDREDIIDWTVEYNYGEESIGTITLTDELSHGEVLEDTIKVYQVDIDIDGNIIGETVEIEVTPVRDDEGNLTFPGLDAEGQAYYITFSSSVPVGLNDTVINTISDDLQNPNADDAEVDVNTIPTGGKAGEQHVDEEGKPYIEWTITMNSEKIDVGSIDIIDVFDPVYLGFDVENETLFELKKDGEEVDNFNIEYFAFDEEDNDDRTGFALTVTDAGPHTYEFIYRTYYTIAGMNEPELANNAQLIFNDSDGIGIGDTIDVDFGQEGPNAGIQKSGQYVTNEDATEQEIEWTIVFNNSKILLENPLITDTFTSGNYEYVDGSLAVSTDGGETLPYNEEFLTDDGFALQFTGNTNAIYTITYRTTTDETANEAHTNEAVLTWQGGNETATAGVGKRNPGINKNGTVQIDDNGNKTIDWTIGFNENRNVLQNVTVTDDYSPSSATVSDITLLKNGIEVDSTQYSVTGPENGSFTVDIGKLDAVPYQISYTTTLSPEEELSEVENSATIDYTGGEEDAHKNIPSPTLGVSKAATNLNKDSENPVITWEIIANTDSANNYVNLVDPVLKDTIPEDQRLLGDTINVVRSDGTTVSIDEEDITYDNNSFSINLPNGPYQYIVTFNTEILEYPSVNEQLDRYTNETTLSSDNHDDASDDAYQDYFADEESGLVSKSGEQNPDTEDIDWTVSVNEEGLTINNPEISDSLSDNQTYIDDSIIVMDGSNTELAEESYTLSVAEDKRSFIVKFTDNVINEQVNISYSTRLNKDLIGTFYPTNQVSLSGGQEQREIDTSITTSTAQQWTYGGGGTGNTLEFTLNKESPNGRAIENATFDFLRVTTSGSVVPIGGEGIKTDENGKFEIKNARAGRYIVTETSAPEGFVQLADPLYMIIGYATPAEAEETGSDYIIKLTDSEWNVTDSDIADGIGEQLTIINEYEPVSTEGVFVANKSLTGQDLAGGQFEFELVDADGNVVATASNDTEGNVIFEEQSFNSPGTYNFKIREVDGGLGGVTYDDSEYDVQVRVSEGENGLDISEVNYLDGAADFENSYQVAPTEATIQVEKQLNGQDLSEGQFYFELVEAEEVIQTVSNNADGTVNFETIEYSESGDHTYTIREVNSGQGGMDYDDTEFEVEVAVTDDGEGQLHADVTYPDDTTPVFTNNYAAESGSIVLEAQKVLEGRDITEDDNFEFQLIGQDDDVNETVSSDVNGDIAFSEINYNTPGKYNYTIQEVAGELGGVEYDETVQNVTVTVTDNGEGQLVTEAAYDNGEAVFTNTYTTNPTEAVITGTKILNGQALEADQFSFELYNDEGHRIQTVNNDAEGNFSFKEIVYDTPGEHNYTVQEVQGSQGGIAYDTNEISVNVSVVDNGEGQLEATVNYIDGPVSFTNNYEAAPDSVVLEAEKILEGQVLRDGQFAFELLDENDEVIDTASNNSKGQVIFDEISYDEVGTHYYTIREKVEDLGGITQDPAVYGVTVEVTDDGEGQLLATETYDDGPAVFTNTYTAEPDRIVIVAHKHLEGQELVNGQFTFELVDESSEAIQENITNNANGQIIFDEITYKEEGIHTYIIREVEGVQGGMTYDDSQYVVVVTVEDDGQGNLVAEPNYIGGPPVFVNSYESTPDSAVIEASKVLEGQELRNDQFTFELKDLTSGETWTKTNNAEGQVIFDEITYEEAGDYNYTIREVEGTQGGVTYDDTVYNVVVSVTDDREGTLTAEVQYTDGSAAFKNTYVPAPDSVIFEASKRLNGQDLRINQFYFELVDEAGNAIQTTSSNANGQVIFEEMSFDTVGTYEYTIREVKGDQGGMTYDDTVYSVTVEVTDDAEGQLTATETYSAGKVQFTNTYVPASDSLVFEATKALDGQDLRNGQFEFSLLDYQGEPLQTVKNNKEGQIIFDEITYDAVGEYEYTIVELKGSQGGVAYDNSTFSILVTVTDDGEGQLTATADFFDGPANFNNTYSADAAIVQFDAEKVLEGKDLVAEQFNFEVVNTEGEVVATGTNNIAGDINFEAIEYTEVGTHEYTIREVTGEDININYDIAEFEVVVEITDDGEGQLHASVDYADETRIFENKFKKVSVGDYVWIDENKDGLQDDTDIPLEGVVLVLKDEEGNIVTENVYGNAIEPQVTDENGFYTFVDLPINNTYTVEIDREASKEALKGLMPTIETEDNRENDSSTWSAESIFLDEDGQRDPTLDFGFVRERVSVGDYVWIDENRDGLQDDTDIPLKGVTLILKDSEGNIVTEDVDGNPIEPQVTDENGYYSFDNLPSDRTYTVEIDREAFEKDFPELTPTLENAGDRETDSSIWSADSVFLDEDGQRDPTLDFGFVYKVVNVSIVKTWEDDNNASETRPDFITVNLFANGELVYTIDMTEEYNWEFTFLDLPEYQSGEVVEYTITEEAVEGYESRIDGFNIINTLIEEEPPTPSDPEDPEEEPEEEDPAPEVTETAGTGTEKSEENKLPSTATNMYNMLMIGLALLILGIAIALYQRRRQTN